MINIKEKSQCCGCSACLHICPKQSISFTEDKEGFLYPEVDMATCIDCGLCEKVCPVINQNDERSPFKVYAAKHPNDDIRMNSSSGGIFTLLAEQIIDEGGVVFGAKFNECWEVVHDFADTKEGLVPFRGSKYVQSRIGEAYVNAEKFLKSGRKVMFTGTPCQIAGLKNYLRKEYENLLAVDFVCHGVPSPMLWRKYLEEEIRLHKNAILTDVNFRDKSTGWKKFSFVLSFCNSTKNMGEKTLLSSLFNENPYMSAFMSNLSLRPSCYACSAKSGKSGADITIGDFWGIDVMRPDFDDDKGVSLLMVNNFGKLDFIHPSFKLFTYEDAKSSNACIERSVSCPVNRDYFMRQQKISSFANSLYRCQTNKLIYRVVRFFYRLLNRKSFDI